MPYTNLLSVIFNLVSNSVERKRICINIIQNTTQNISQHEENQYGLTKLNISLRYQVWSKSSRLLGKMFGGNESDEWF
jgi:hypothetical protein